MNDDANLEIEVSNLRTGQALSPPLAQTNTSPHQSGITTPSPPLIAEASMDEISIERLPSGEGDSAQEKLPPWSRLLHSPRLLHLAPPQARRLRGLLVGTALLVVFGGLLLSLPATQHSISGLLRLPTPTATAPLSFGADTVL